MNPYDEAIERLNVANSALRPIGRDLDHIQRLATLGTLTAGIAHEINNILTPILAYAQLARENPDDRAFVAKALDRVIGGIGAASRITESILGLASAKPDGRPVENHADVGEVARAAADCVGQRLKRQGIELAITTHPGSCVAMPRIALQHVLLNLLINACDAMPDGGTIRIAAESTVDGRTEIRVSDSGRGIAPDIAGRIFEPFVQAAGSVSEVRGHGRQRGGFGLGLAICRHLVSRHGGTIELESSRDRGTTFVVSVPSSCMIAAKAG